MGMSLAAWQDHLNIHSIATTGYIDVAFVRCELIKMEAHRGPTPVLDTTTARVTCDGQSIYIDMEVDINNAHPGLNVWIEYEIENRGSLPVTLKSNKESRKLLYPGTLKVENKLSQEILESGETITGEIHIILQGVKENSNIRFTMPLNFEQWNMVP